MCGLSRTIWHKNCKFAHWFFQYKFFLKIVYFRTSVGLPYTSPHCLLPAPYGFLRANDILVVRPATIFCKINWIGEKTTARQQCPWETHRGAIISLPFPYHFLTISLQCTDQIQNSVWGEPFSGCWRLLTISLQFPDHVLTKYKTVCEGGHLVVAHHFAISL